MTKKPSSTQEKLLTAAYEEVYNSGYHGTGLNTILQKANLNKGSMYHLYKSKKDLILDVIDKKVKKRFTDKYAPLSLLDKNIIEELLTIIKDKNKLDFKRGCPLNNLIQELSPTDVDFRNALEEVYFYFEDSIKKALDRAIEIGEIKQCNTQELSMFIVSLIEGALITAKKSQNKIYYDMVINQLEAYLKKF